MIDFKFVFYLCIVMFGVGLRGDSGPNAPIVLGINTLRLNCLDSSSIFCIPFTFICKASGTFLSPIALNKALQKMLIISVILNVATVFIRLIPKMNYPVNFIINHNIL